MGILDGVARLVGIVVLLGAVVVGLLAVVAIWAFLTGTEWVTGWLPGVALSLAAVLLATLGARLLRGRAAARDVT